MRWRIYASKGTVSVRRWIGGKPLDLKDKGAFKHAFIDDSLLTDYFSFLSAQIPSLGVAKTEFYYLRTYALKFFIVDLGLLRVEDWYDVHETKWAEYLLSRRVPKSSKSKRDIVNSLNRFIGWLHKRRPTEVPLKKFIPISKAKFKRVEADRLMKGEARVRRLIPPGDWTRIQTALTRDIEPFVRLAYSYGLRRNETLGIHQNDIRTGSLHVERQLVKLGSYGPLKGRVSRQVPHWFATPAQCYQWIRKRQHLHPSTLTVRWKLLMKALKLNYDFHDLRHTFITNAIRLKSPTDVRLAAVSRPR